MSHGPRRARDPDLLDSVDAFERLAFEGRVWRVARDGRDPVLGSPSGSRWCNGTFDVLYTSLERAGALAEIHSLLSQQPVFPSKPTWLCHEIAVTAERTLRLATLAVLDTLGVDTAHYRERRYERTQEIADAAYFLDFDGLVVPSARWDCQNLVLFTERLPPDAIRPVALPETIDWAAWRAAKR